MLRTVYHSLLTLLLLPLSYRLVSATDYGVGFHLSLDHGVASVYYSNGSAVDVAKVAGGFNYKQMMRAAYHSAETTPYDDQGTFARRTQKSFLDFQYLRDHLPSWRPSWPGHEDRSYQSLVPMVKALKTAIESYLEEGISTAEIVTPFPVDEIYHNMVRKTFSAVSLQMPNYALPPAGVLAARAHNIGNKSCTDSIENSVLKDDPQQLVLTVEFSRSALTALLLHEVCGIYEVRRVLHSTELGLDHLQWGSDHGGGLNNLENKIKELISLPMDDGGNGEELTFINNLVVFGESADSSQLNRILKKVLGEQFERLTDSAHGNEYARIDPLFAASRGVAYDCWDRLHFEEYRLGDYGCLIA
ncbi:hypothetical protein EJ08DRAFT_699061 [Tothia fuscella]|uniref:Uncharacterized protein n=1 Tax=Tothia fuscella TaxID=1048955 RepID=A0A9P4TVX2_9PEZI|nr:hypothetical protein EJ08DRAFT_699061 [Tothia fuscella]